MKNILSILALFLAFTACKDPKAVTDVLNRAEVLMNEHPDSSLTLLRTLTFDDFQKESNRARYALLHSQALDKNYIDVTGDSLISVAVEYYKDKDDVRSKFLSYYYMGRVHANGERYLQATSCLMESEQLVEEVGDDYLSGLLYSEMGRIYRLYYDYPKSLEAYQKAVDFYERAGMIRHRNYMWLNKSSVYRDMNRDDEGEELLKKVLESAKAEDDNTLAGSCKGNLVMLYIKQGKMKDARELYEKWESIVGLQSASSSFMAELALMYAEEGNFNQAQSFIQEGWKHVANRMDSVSLSLSSAKIHYIQGKGMAAYEEVVKGMSLQNRGIRQALQQPVLTAQRDYLSEKLEYEAYRLQMEKHLRILYIFIFVSLLSLMVFVLYRKLHKEKEKARKTIDGLHAEMLRKEETSRQELDALLKELEQKDKITVDNLEKLRSALKHQEENHCQYVRQMEEVEKRYQEVLSHKTVCMSKLFKAWFEVMGKWMMLFRNTVNKKDVSKFKMMAKEISTFEENYFIGNKAYCQLEKLLNAYHGDVMLHFRKEVKLSDEVDYKRVCYFFVGLSPEFIAWLMDEKIENVYQRRLRLRKKISSSAPLHKDLFLLLLGK